MTTVAGSSGGIGNHDGAPADARFWRPTGVAADAAGNVYVADHDNHTIRKISPTGTVGTLAGLANVPGSTDAYGSAARFRSPSGVAVDANGNVYVADSYNHLIRKVTRAGVVTTVAGVAGSSGSEDGTSSARFRTPFAVAVDSNGNIFVSDRGNHTIRRIDSAGAVSTLAGVAGQSGSADGTTQARFSAPAGIATDAAGNVYVADTANHTIRRITTTGEVSTLAGLAGQYGLTDGVGDQARFRSPMGITIAASGDLYVAESLNRTVRKVTVSGQVTLVAGINGPTGNTDGPAMTARFYDPMGIAADPSGNLYVADQTNHVIRKITDDASVSTLAGVHWWGFEDGPGPDARFNSLSDIVSDGSGNFYAADTNNHTIRRIASDGTVSTLAGQPRVLGSADGTGSAARFGFPEALTIDGGGNLYVADMFNHTIRKVTPNGTVSTLAGLPGTPGDLDGTGTNARFNEPSGVAVDPAGNVYVVDRSNHTIRAITPQGTVSTFAGLSGNPGSVDATGQNARFDMPARIAIGPDGTLWVTESSCVLRRITTEGAVTTFAGAYLDNRIVDGTGADARFAAPGAVTIDGSGSLYVTDARVVRMVGAGGQVSTLTPAAGNLGFHGVAVDPSGDLFVTDGVRLSVRRPALPDLATIDVATGPIGVARRLNTQFPSATTWEWRVVRQPADTTATLSAQSARDPSFTPQAADLHTFRLVAKNFAGTAISTVDLMATAAGSGTLLVSSPNPSSIDELITLTATLSGPGVLPSGTVTFSEGATVFGTATVNPTGQATITVSSLSVGTHVLTAAYGGDVNYSPSTFASHGHTVNNATATEVMNSLATSTYGQNVTFTATVTSTGGTPFGSVTFYDGANPIGTSSLNASGQATRTTAALPTGTRSITARFGGAAGFHQSVSTPITQTVTIASTTTALSATPPASSTRGQPVTFTVTVSAVSPGGGIPTGNVTFFDGAQALAGPLSTSSGMFTLTTTVLTAGTHSITTQYEGTTNHASSTSSALTFEVTPAATQTALFSSANPWVEGETVTLTATVSATPPGGGTPTGTVTFKVGPSTLGAAFLSGGAATLNTSPLPIGLHALSAVYEGTSDYGTSTSSTLIQAIQVFSPPSTVSAAATSTATVAVHWSASLGAIGYHVLRRSETMPLTVIATVSAPVMSYADSTVNAGASYLYAIQAIRSAGLSSISLADLATTIMFTDDPVIAQVTLVKVVHMTQMRTAIAAVRRLAGLPPAAFAAIDNSVSIAASHLSEMRPALMDALAVLQLPTPTLTDGTITPGVTAVKAAHLQELRTAAK